jgi:hypothetical protein
MIPPGSSTLGLAQTKTGAVATEMAKFIVTTDALSPEALQWRNEILEIFSEVHWRTKGLDSQCGCKELH